MFIRLMQLLEKNSGKFASNLMEAIRARNEARRTAGRQGGEEGPDSPRKMGAVYEDLLEWVFDNLKKGNLVAYYASLGERSRLRGVPLEELVTAILVIQKEIMALIIDEIDSGDAFSLSGHLDIVFRVNLFFDLIMHSVVSVYHKEPAQAVFDNASENPVMSTIFLG
jgi:hypothetical protein